MRNVPILTTLCVMAAAVAPSGLRAQTERDAIEAYFHAVGDYFKVSPREVGILSEWQIAPDEVPVVLFLAQKGGIASDAVVALRRSGRSWADLARRYGVGPGDFHVGLADGAAAGSLSHAYDLYRSTPSSGWGRLELSDADIVGLVNVKVLSESTGVAPAQVVATCDRAGSWVAGFRTLLRGR